MTRSPLAPSDLLRLAEAMAAHSGQSIATISNKATGGGRFFKDLSAGKGCTIRTFRKVMEWFALHWPADLPWPADIPRPCAPETAP
jgi:hypothetical protein